MATFKIQYQEEVRRASYDHRTTSWNSFRTSVGQLFTIPAESITSIRYNDSDGDLITLSSDLELTQLLQHYSTQSTTNNPLKVIVVTSSTSTSSSSSTGATPPLPTATPGATGDANVEEILRNLGPFGDFAREVLQQNPMLKEEAERFAKSMASGEQPAFPAFFGCGPSGAGAGAGAGAPGAFGFPFGLGGFPGQPHHQHPFPFQPQSRSQSSQPESRPQPQPQPQSQAQQDETVYSEQLRELGSMGFIDKTLNLQLLRKYNGNVEKVLLEIFWLQQQAESV